MPRDADQFHRTEAFMIIRSAALTLSLLLAAPVQAQDIIAIGDSIMDWNGAQSVPAQLSRELGLPVDDRSLAGSQISTGFWDRMEGLDIRAQLGDDRPDILVMTGGGNDLGERCGCRAGCDEEAVALLTEDGGGAFGDFLHDVVADGTQVFVLGYADPPVGGNDFSGCIADLRALADRLDALEGVTLVPVHQAIDPADMSYYDADRVHPSVKASLVMAKLLARAIEASR
jgi:lysophospholipase L1-like esterase